MERRRTLAAGGLLVLLILNAFWGVVTRYAMAGKDVSQRWQTPHADRLLFDALALSGAVLFLSAGALWMVWQYASHQTLWQRGIPDLRYGPKVVWWWLLGPFAAFTAVPAIAEIARCVPSPRGRPHITSVALVGWFSGLVALTVGGGASWEVFGGNFGTQLSSTRGTTTAIAAIMAIPLVLILESGLARVLPWHHPSEVTEDLGKRAKVR